MATAASTTADRAHGHSHGGGHGHSHSHGSIEESISGSDLFQCKMATLAGGATNVFFCITKIWLGSSGGSVALLADGVHALTDLFADVVSYASITLSQKKLPRCRYPFGIGRLETSGAVVVAAILFLGGVILLVQSAESCISDLGKLVGYFMASSGGASVLAAAAAASSVDRHVAHDASDHHGHGHDHDHGHSHDEALADESDGHDHSHGAHGHSHFELTQVDSTGKQVIMWTMVALAASSVVCKELLFHWTRRVGLKAGSRVVVANAYHHRVDAWSSAVALVGVAGQCVGIPGIDGLAGLVVSLSICRIGYGLFRDAVMEFFDYQRAEDIASVRDELQAFHVKVDPTEVLTDDSITSCGGTAATTATEEVYNSKIRFINVFLMRHGRAYALHVTLLVHENVTTKQVQEATQLLTDLAKKSLPVNDTYIALMTCGADAVPRADYEEHGVTGVHKRTGKLRNTIAATGELVNPSLECCIQDLMEFHGFAKPITYNWETRQINVPFHASMECCRDIESVAKMFRCALNMKKKSSSSGASGSDTESEHSHEHSHGHNHSHGHRHEHAE